MNLFSRYHQRGFTLVEILVIIAIITLLMAIVFTAIDSAREKSRDAKRISDMKQIKLALVTYYEVNGEWPCRNSDTGFEYGFYLDGDNCLTDALTPHYIPSIPTDPLHGDDGVGQSGKDYHYSAGRSAGREEYSLRTRLEGSPVEPNASHPGGNYCQSEELPKCDHRGEDCVYAYGGGCTMLWYHVGGF